MAKIDLNEQQRRAVEHPGGPLLIIAGAGSGKTRALTSRLKHLIEQKVPPHEIIAITFTNKAAKEMRIRVFGADQAEPKWSSRFPVFGRPFIGTFHSLGMRILKEDIDLAFKRNKSFSIYDDKESLSVVKKILKEMDLSKESYNPKKILNQISWVKSELKQPEDLPEDRDSRADVFKRIYQRYEDELIKNNAFDFDDLLEKPVRMFLKNKELLNKYQEKFSHILVDEYQDINTIQYRLVRLLVGKHQNITVVGDDAQAIYAFRGADFRNFLNFTQDWPKAEVIKLEQNYRSTKNIIGGAGEVINNNKIQNQKELWTDNEEGELIKIIGAEEPDIEATWVANEVLALQDKNPENEVAILYRTNAQSRAIEQALISANINYKIYGGLKFYDRKEVKDVLAGIRLVVNPQDTASMSRLEKSMGKRRASGALEALKTLREDTRATDIIKLFMEDGGYAQFLSEKFDNVQERLENIMELIVFSAQFESLEEFLERVSLLEATDRPSGGDKSEKAPIVLMTIHMAKGLEFDYVFLVGANEGLLPHEKSMESEAQVEEERRLMYVAMTRARRVLYILFHSFPSRFLYEIDKDCCEFISPTGNWSELPSDEDVWIE